MVNIIFRYLFIKLQHVFINNYHDQGNVFRVVLPRLIHNFTQKEIKHVYAFHIKYKSYIHTHILLLRQYFLFSSYPSSFSLFYSYYYFFFG
jgi:hypothetical protein